MVPPMLMQLNVGYYQQSCSAAKSIVKKVIYRSLSANPNLGAGLIRLHFHDDFVRGCDALILLKSRQGKETETKSVVSTELRGFKVVEADKQVVEAQCPECGNIELDPRGIPYDVPRGRYDVVVSLEDEPIKKLSNPMSILFELGDKFVDQGLTVEDMVILSGAHSIGDPSMDPQLAEVLKDICPTNSTTPATSLLNFQTPNRLDNRFYVNVQERRGVFRSDQVLLDSHITKRLVNEFTRDDEAWKHQFVVAMVLGWVLLPGLIPFPSKPK
ncbi:hypothetical protein RND81_01G135900 [Saponaria officinalis]|uniref:peroxidase n=1 Tax=Saponaria officinalis TaxID=3572 RepID=A0AAW1NF16_SAPOF